MTSHLIETDEDMQWLVDTHGVPAGYAIAIVTGDEDDPDLVELYRENKITCNPTIVRRNAESGKLEVVAVGDKPTTAISNEAKELFADLLLWKISEVFEDPDENFQTETREQFLGWYDKMVRICEEIGVDFWTGNRFTTQRERNRLKQMLRECGRAIDG